MIIVIKKVINSRKERKPIPYLDIIYCESDESIEALSDKHTFQYGSNLQPSLVHLQNRISSKR